MLTHPPTDARLALSDTVAYLKTIADDAGRIASALVVHHQNIADHEVKGKIHRLKVASEDFGHVVRREISSMSKNVSEAIERRSKP